MEQSFVFGSVSGSVFAFWFFGAMSLFAGFAVYELSSNVRYRRAAFRRFGVLPRWQGLIFGGSLTLLVAAALYLSMLDGFYGLAVRGDEIRLNYILPSRTLALQRAEIAEVRTEPSYRSRWRLRLYTPTGGEFVSARGSFAEVRAAGKFLTAHIGTKPEGLSQPVTQP
ncbi:MAG: hypothetical protein ACRD6I_18060 [Candidatus Acidiferrales bacterium]